MGVSSTRVGDHRGSARTVQYLSKNHMMVSGLRSARSGALPHLAVFAAESPVCVSPLSPLSSLSRLSIISLSLSSRLGLVILGWQWSASPGVVRFHPGLSSPYRIPPPPPRELGLASCFKFQASSFLDLNIPPVLLSLPAPRSLEYLEPLCWDTLLIASPLPPSPFCVV